MVLDTPENRGTGGGGTSAWHHRREVVRDWTARVPVLAKPITPGHGVVTDSPRTSANDMDIQGSLRVHWRCIPFRPAVATCVAAGGDEDDASRGHGQSRSRPTARRGRRHRSQERRSDRGGRVWTALGPGPCVVVERIARLEHEAFVLPVPSLSIPATRVQLQKPVGGEASRSGLATTPSTRRTMLCALEFVSFEGRGRGQSGPGVPRLDVTVPGATKCEMFLGGILGSLAARVPFRVRHRAGYVRACRGFARAEAATGHTHRARSPRTVVSG